MALTEQSIARLCIISSATLAAIAFLSPLYCAESIFIFLVPIFYALFALDYRMSFKDGVAWGSIFYIVFFFDISLLIVYKGIGIVRFFAALFLIIYGMSITGCWFFLAHTLCSFSKKNSTLIAIICWSITTVLYTLFIEHLFFCIFGRWEGMILQSFVLPLTIRSQWLYYCSFIGTDLFFCCIMALNILGAYALSSARYLLLGFSLFVLVALFCAAGLLKEEEIAQSWIRQIGCIVVDTDKHTVTNAAEQIMNALHNFQKLFPQCCILLMPESSFSFPLNQLKKYLSLWDCSSKLLLIGSHRYEENRLYNTLYCIKEGAIIDFYDKNHRMVFTEQIPPLWADFPGADTLFLSNAVPFCAGSSKNIINLPALGAVRPLICSELFFNAKQLKSEQIYLCLVNDSWFFSSYLSNLMVLQAKTVAITKKSIVIYCSYRHQLLITARGNCFHLPALIA